MIKHKSICEGTVNCFQQRAKYVNSRLHLHYSFISWIVATTRVRWSVGRDKDQKMAIICVKSHDQWAASRDWPNGPLQNSSVSLDSCAIVACITSEVVSLVESSEASTGWRRSKFDSSVSDEVQRRMLMAWWIPETEVHTFLQQFTTNVCLILV